MRNDVTIDFYNKNAENYFRSTVDVDFSEAYDRFLKYIPEHGSIIDMGCGSGRDTAAFAEMGYDAIGLDASRELAEIARKEKKVDVIVEDMADYVAEKSFDGIWCCASLLHLNDDELYRFFLKLDNNLKNGGAIYVSVKSGIKTGYDEKGRYMRNFTENELRNFLSSASIRIVERWSTVDQLNREGFHWINIVGIKE